MKNPTKIEPMNPIKRASHPTQRGVLPSPSNASIILLLSFVISSLAGAQHTARTSSCAQSRRTAIQSYRTQHNLPPFLISTDPIARAHSHVYSERLLAFVREKLHQLPQNVRQNLREFSSYSPENSLRILNALSRELSPSSPNFSGHFLPYPATRLTGFFQFHWLDFPNTPEQLAHNHRALPTDRWRQRTLVTHGGGLPILSPTLVTLVPLEAYARADRIRGTHVIAYPTVATQDAQHECHSRCESDSSCFASVLENWDFADESIIECLHSKLPPGPHSLTPEPRVVQFLRTQGLVDVHVNIARLLQGSPVEVTVSSDNTLNPPATLRTLPEHRAPYFRARSDSNLAEARHELEQGIIACQRNSCQVGNEQHLQNLLHAQEEALSQINTHLRNRTVAEFCVQSSSLDLNDQTRFRRCLQIPFRDLLNLNRLDPTMGWDAQGVLMNLYDAREQAYINEHSQSACE